VAIGIWRAIEKPESLSNVVTTRVVVCCRAKIMLLSRSNVVTARVNGILVG